MMKKIKVKKQMRLDELIKYVWDNAIYPSHFECHAGFKIHFDSRAGIKVDNDYVHSDATVFTVEVEEAITENTVFQTLIEIDKWQESHEHTCESFIGAKDDDTIAVYALIEFRLELIWEAE